MHLDTAFFIHTQAMLINRLSASELGISERQAQKLRQKEVKEVLSQNFSTAQTQEWVKVQRQAYPQLATSEPSSKDKQVERLLSTVQNLDLSYTQPSTEQLQALQQT